MDETLYETDILIWAERQAGLLARLAAGERLNETVDWAHVIEEVRDVGLSELRACESLLEQALLHLMKLVLEPDSAPGNHWRGEIVGFLAGARRRFVPSMRQRIELNELYEDARTQALTRLGRTAPTTALPADCPFPLDDLLARDPAIDTLLTRLRPPDGAP